MQAVAVFLQTLTFGLGLMACAAGALTNHAAIGILGLALVLIAAASFIGRKLDRLSLNDRLEQPRAANRATSSETFR